MDDARVGDAIKQWRLSANLSQRALARVAGVSRRTVQKAELGEVVPISPVVRVLGRACGVGDPEIDAACSMRRDS